MGRSINSPAAATVAAFIAPEHVRALVARATIRGGAQSTGQGGHGRPVSESSEAGTLEGGAARAVITGARLVGHLPLEGRRNGSV
jgi:hypothetical protein